MILFDELIKNLTQSRQNEKPLISVRAITQDAKITNQK